MNSTALIRLQLKCLAWATLTTISFSLSAQVTPVYRSLTCGEFMANQTDKVYITVAAQYIRGFASGHNLYSSRRAVSSDLPDATIALWLQKFCSANPLLGVENAAPALVNELIGPKGSR